MRYDLDGNGQVADDPLTMDINESTVYSTAFGTPSCVAGSACEGYELMNDLDFNDADGAGAETTASVWAAPTAPHQPASPVSGGWVPIGEIVS